LRSCICGLGIDNFPIILSGASKLVTLRYAAEYITQLPDAERGLPHACAMG
jgi:hypothetical protein